MSIINRTAIAVSALAIAVAPSAFAKGNDQPHGKSGESHGKAHQHHGKAKGHAKAHNVVFKGTVASVADDGTVTVSVTKATKWGRELKGTDVAFTVKKFSVADTNGDQVRDAKDVQAGDKVVVKARIAKDDEAPYAARQLVDQTRPKADDEQTEGDDDGTPDQGTGDVPTE